MFRGGLAAVTPIVGTARVASATGKIVEALAVEIETAGAAGKSAVATPAGARAAGLPTREPPEG